jgi:hypothetical protein
MNEMEMKECGRVIVMYMVQITILEATNCPSRLRVICDAVSFANMAKPIATMPP